MSRFSRATPSAPIPRPSAPPSYAPPVASLLRAPVLVVSPDGQYELVRGSLTIGRSAEVDIPLNDSLVSRVHARIIVTPEGVAIEDLHSTNGVYVNADRTSGRSQPLREGDRILIDIPNRRLELLVDERTLAKRREAAEARGRDAFRPNRDRHVSTALQAYALMTTSAARGAVRDLAQLTQPKQSR